MLITCATINSEEWSIAKLDSNWAYSRAWDSLIIDVGRSSTSFPFIGSSFKSKPKWTSLSNAESTKSTMPTTHPSYHIIQDQTYTMRLFSTAAIHRWITHYKDNTKKWLGFMINIGGKMHWWLASFLVLNSVMSDQSLQTRLYGHIGQFFILYGAFPTRFWDLVLGCPLILHHSSLYLVIHM